MKKISKFLFTFTFILVTSLLLSSTATKKYGDLLPGFIDENGDLVADAPKDIKKQLDPSTLIFSYTPVEDPEVYRGVWE